MQVSLNWLKDYVGLDVGVGDLCAKMTMLGLEIENVQSPGLEIQGVVVGEILAIEAHPDADKLVVCSTTVGEGDPLQIVCGATNMSVGDKVPTARVGGLLPGGFKIGKRKMRGIESQGMMCSAKELNLGEDHEGLLILDPELPVGQDVHAPLGLDDVIVEIEVTPNRGDWSSMFGVARELAAAYGKTLEIPKIDTDENGPPATELSSVAIEAPDLCPRYVGRVLTGLKIGPSPNWLAQRIAAAGMRPINNVVDVTNYVMMETGQPLHAFDFDKLAEGRIVVRRAAQGEQIKVIDQSTHPLKPDMLVIADGKAPVAVAGVMGGFDTEVGEATTRVFLESAYFDPVSIRKTARALNMLTESAQRFQRGADPEITLYAADRAAQLMHEVAGGELAQGALDVYPAPIEAREVTLRYARTRALLGIDVPAQAQKEIVISLGFDVVREDDDSATFRVPPRRHDVSQEADLIEEVARLYGYDRFEETLPEIPPVLEVFAPTYNRLRRLREDLAGAGLNEVLHWTFSSPEETRKALPGANTDDMVAVSNPLSERQSIMRISLVPGLLATVSSNLRKNRGSVSVFETGPVYKPCQEKDLPVQSMRLAVALSGTASEKHWSEPQRSVDFYDLRGHAEAILDSFGLELQLEVEDLDGFVPGQSGVIMDGKTRIGRLGKSADAVLEAFQIEQAVYVLELDIDGLLAKKEKHEQFAPIPPYPPSLRDMAVVVDDSVPAGALLAAADKSGGKLLKRAELFDVYTGKQVPEGKKSVALSLVFQSGDRTLTDKDTQKAWDKILRRLQDEFSAELR